MHLKISLLSLIYVDGIDPYGLPRMAWLTWPITLEPDTHHIAAANLNWLLKSKDIFMLNNCILSVIDYLLYAGLIVIGSRYIGTLGKANFA